MRTDGEKWLPIDGRRGFYVSDQGRVRGPGGYLKGTPVGTHGYPVVGFWVDGSTETELLHRLVTVAFSGPVPFVGAQAAHRNGVRTDCRASNLRWLTAAENGAEKYLHGTHLQGGDCPWSKLTDADVLEIRSAPKGTPLRALAERFGVTKNHIAKLRTRSRGIWPHIPFPEQAGHA